MVYYTSPFQKFALSHGLLAAASKTLHRLRQEDNGNTNEENQRAVVRPTGVQDSEGDSNESDQEWEDAEDMGADEKQLADLDQHQLEVGDPPLPLSTT